MCAQPCAAQQKTLPPSEFVAWLPVSAAERDQKSPVVEKDAGAEILFWRVHVVDELLSDNRSFQRVFYNYVRLKVFDDGGREKTATIDLPYRAGRVTDVSGRTTKADGTTLELDRKTVYQRDLERIRGQRESVISFAMPGVEKGAILEYRWRQTEDDNRFRYLRLRFQREFPAQLVTYFVKPLSSAHVAGEELYILPFNCKTTPIKLEPNGFSSTSVENVPATHFESFSPSAPNIEPWALLYYRHGEANARKYWEDAAKDLNRQFRESVKVDDEMKSGATKAAAASDQDAKIAALATYVKKSVRNLNDRELTAADREEFLRKLPKDRRRNSAEIFKSGIGTSQEINIVFGALAAQAGFDVRAALVADRGEIAFRPEFAERYFLSHEAMALKDGDSWKLVDISDKTVPPGLLPWREEGMYALLGDPKAPGFVQVPYSSPETSSESRTARLELSRDGSLAGTVEEAYTGHRGEDYRNAIGFMSSAQREEWLRNRVTRMFPNSDVTEIKFDNVDDASKPLSAHYALQAPRFAQVTGKRILLQPNAFRRGQGSPFGASQRYNPVEFPYGWKEDDNVNIRLPEGFTLDSADSPGNLDFGKPGTYVVKIVVVPGARQELHYTRTLIFGNAGLLSYDRGTYAALKKGFDQIQIRDSHAISLKENDQ
jgi:hypothetical protein